MYIAQITREQPTAFIFTIDRSYSMDEPVGGDATPGAIKRKADAVADALNRVLDELTIRCGREEGVRPYFHIAVIGYHGDTAESAYEGALQGKDLVSISDLAESPLRIEDREVVVDDGVGGTRTTTAKFAVWFEAVASGGTPMCKALVQAHKLASEWATAHPHAFPPIILNITDGESTDGPPEPAAEALRAIAVDDGNALVLNLHISSLPNQPVLFPHSEAHLADEFARLLFRMSSVLPPVLRDAAIKEGFSVSDEARGFGFNADVATIVRFLNIGTQLKPSDR